MPYPEPGASYKRHPKWLEEAQRAEGGRLHPQYPTTAEMINARDALRRDMEHAAESLDATAKKAEHAADAALGESSPSEDNKAAKAEPAGSDEGTETPEDED